MALAQRTQAAEVAVVDAAPSFRLDGSLHVAQNEVDLLPRQPLRFLLADDPGAGKTIMAGLLIKELSPAATCNVASSSAPEAWPSSGRTNYGTASSSDSAS